MTSGVLTLTNLFPSHVMPTHGLFVYERMRRVMAAAPDLQWQVVSPVPHVAWFVRGGSYRRWSEVPAREDWQGVPVHHPRYRHWPGLSMRRQAAAMAAGAEDCVRALVKGRQMVIDAHYLWPDGVAAATLAKRMGLPYMLTARGSDLNVVANDRVIAGRIREAARSAHACFAVSTALCDRFAEVCDLPRQSIQLARNGVDFERFHPGDTAAERRQLGLPEDAWLMLGVGRLVPGKGFAVAAQALRHLPDHVHLVLVGDGPERAAILSEGADRVHCLGAQPPDVVARAYRACDVLVLPSEREGWPNVVTEALASGLRVVATAVGGIPEILGDPPPADGSLGVLVRPRPSPEQLAEAVQSMLSTPGDRDRVQAFAQRYGWEQPVALLLDACRSALADGRAA